MNDVIKEILEELENMYEISELEEQVNNINKIKDYITNLQQDTEMYAQLKDEYEEEIKDLQQENERLKKVLNCKEYFSSTMPEDIEFVILTKNNYDRQQKDIQFELIDCKSRLEKAVEYIKKYCIDDEFYINLSDKEKAIIEVLNILQNGSDIK